MKKVVIIDDESAGRQLIREYLKAYPTMVLVGEANNGVDAIKLINEFKPDLVFLDIQMPGLTGFEVLPHLDVIPDIIFSTAYDQYALQAFEVHAVDYLLKPYTRERFRNAISRIEQPAQAPNVSRLAESLMLEKQRYPERILVESGRKFITLAVKDIIRIEASGDYSRLLVGEQAYLSHFGISKLEEKLDPDTFIRVHRSAMINLHFISKVEKSGQGFDIRMKNGDQVRVSRGYSDKLRDLIF